MESAQQASGALKIVGATLAGGALAGVAALGITGAGSTLMWTVIGVGLILITVLLAGYVLIIKSRVSKRAAAADRSLVDMIRVKPRGVSDPLLLAKLDQLGVMVVGSTPEELGPHLKVEMEKWAPVIKAANIKVNE